MAVRVCVRVRVRSKDDLNRDGVILVGQQRDMRRQLDHRQVHHLAGVVLEVVDGEGRVDVHVLDEIFLALLSRTNMY